MKPAGRTRLRADVKTVARAWRWGHRPLVPRSVEPPAAEHRDFPTAWARTETGKLAREALQRFALAPLLAAETRPKVHGLDVFEHLRGPAIFVANHSSHLDAPFVLTSLPREWARRTATGAAADYFFDVWWRAAATALVFNAFPVERSSRKRSNGSRANGSRANGSSRATALARELIAEGWSILMFPEGTRSRDGWVRPFKPGAARLAIEHDLPVVPIAIRGSYQSMPRGKGWPAKGRLPVSVRFAHAVRPAPGEDVTAFNDRIRTALAAALDEDRTTWWDARRRAARGDTPDAGGPDAAGWRRRWESSRPMPVKPRAFRT
ncbi:MAG TPA: lysophospholipid acyltransferase family protein [Actinomycetota bacterium]